jgi:hypothetical protein
MKCEWCVYRDKKNLEICKACSLNDPSEMTRPRRDLESVDICKMARILHDKEIQEVKDKIPNLSNCPKCNEHSLRFDRTSNQFECLNKECEWFLKPILYGSELFKQIALKLLNKNRRTFGTTA